jgi:hypothetical protein
MTDIDQQAKDTISKLKSYERNWHLFKALIYVLVGTAIIIVNVYTYNRIIQNSDHNRALLKCALIAFTPSNQDYTMVSSNIHKCVENN